MICTCCVCSRTSKITSPLLCHRKEVNATTKALFDASNPTQGALGGCGKQLLCAFVCLLWNTCDLVTAHVNPWSSCLAPRVLISGVCVLISGVCWAPCVVLISGVSSTIGNRPRVAIALGCTCTPLSAQPGVDLHPAGLHRAVQRHHGHRQRLRRPAAAHDAVLLGTTLTHTFGIFGQTYQDKHTTHACFLLL